MGLSLPLLLLSKSNFNSKCTLCVLPVCGDFKRKWKQWRVNYTQKYPNKGITWLCNHNLINNAPSSLKLLQEIKLQHYADYAMSLKSNGKWSKEGYIVRKRIEDIIYVAWKRGITCGIITWSIMSFQAYNICRRLKCNTVHTMQRH